MEFVDLKKEYNYYKDDIIKSINKIGEKGWFLFGDETDRLEQYFTKLINKKYAISVKNCTDAITMVLKRIYKNDMTIILPNFGAYPTAVACKNITDKLYYVDVDKSMTLDPEKLPKDIKNGIIIPVHLFGNTCDMSNIMRYANDNNHMVLEDCAQSTGSGSGMLGDYAVFSFYPTKPLASMGDGGMICCNNIADYKYFKKLRFYGQHENNIEFVGINSRMDEIQASILNIKSKQFEKFNNKRNEISNRYKQYINGIKINTYSVYHQFVVMFNNRGFIIEKLKEENIPYMIHYPYHVSEMGSLKGIYNSVNFKVNDKIISLPIHSFLLENDIIKIEGFLKKYNNYEC